MTTLLEQMPFDSLITKAMFVRELSALINTGIPLVRSLDICRTSVSNSAMAEVIGDISSRIESGSWVSQAMDEHPDCFDDLGRTLVRAGEHGGVLDETLEAWADLLEREIQLRERLAMYRLLARMADAVAGTSAGNWEATMQDALDETASVLNASVFAYNLGVMLQSSVPVLLALEIARPALDDEAAAAMAEVVDAVRQTDLPEETYNANIKATLQQVPHLPDIVTQLFCIGWETGLLDVTMQRAAELLRLQADRRIRTAMMSCFDSMDVQ